MLIKKVKEGLYLLAFVTIKSVCLFFFLKTRKDKIILPYLKKFEFDMNFTKGQKTSVNGSKFANLFDATSKTFQHWIRIKNSTERKSLKLIAY